MCCLPHKNKALASTYPSKAKPLTGWSALPGKHRFLPHCSRWALEMAARARSEPQWRSKWLLESASKPQGRSKWLLEPARSHRGARNGRSRLPRSRSRSRSSCSSLPRSRSGVQKLRSELLFGETVSVRLFSESLCSAPLCFVHGYARVHISLHIYIYIYKYIYVYPYPFWLKEWPKTCSRTETCASA